MDPLGSNPLGAPENRTARVICPIVTVPPHSPKRVIGGRSIVWCQVVPEHSCTSPGSHSKAKLCERRRTSSIDVVQVHEHRGSPVPFLFKYAALG